jgi:glycosyltransferase involved in cell wall biosynthesis
MTAPFPVVLFTNSMVMGGMEEHILQLSRGLRARGFPVAVICSRHDAIRPLRDALLAAGVQVHALTSGRASLLGALPRTLSLARIFRRYRRGILHLHFTGHQGGDIATFAAVLSGMRAVVRTAHMPPVAPVTARTRRLVGIRDRWLSRLICVSNATLRAHLELLDRDPRKCVVVRNGVDLERFNPGVVPVDVRAEFGIDPAAPLVGTVSRLGEHRKGIHVFVAAAAVVAAWCPPARFLIVGEGPLRAELEAQAGSLGIGRNLVFAGQRDDIPGLLAAMSVFVVPSLYESGPYTLLEAMATGRPVVSTPTGLVTEAVDDGVSGRLVPIGDSDALARAIIEVLDDPARATAMAARGREAVADRFSVESMIDGIVRVYRDVAS